MAAWGCLCIDASLGVFSPLSKKTGFTLTFDRRGVCYFSISIISCASHGIIGDAFELHRKEPYHKTRAQHGDILSIVLLHTLTRRLVAIL